MAANTLSDTNYHGQFKCARAWKKSDLICSFNLPLPSITHNALCCSARAIETIRHRRTTVFNGLDQFPAKNNAVDCVITDF